MLYECTSFLNPDNKTWTSEITVLAEQDNSYEVLIKGRGSMFFAIIGSAAYGNYICIPDADIGCALSDLSDRFWNEERLSHHLSKVDAATIAAGLSQLNEF